MAKDVWRVGGVPGTDTDVKGLCQYRTSESGTGKLLVSALTVADTATFRGAQTLTGTTTMSGDATVGGTLEVTGESTFTAAAQFNGPVTVAAGDTLIVTGPASFADTVTLADNLAGPINATDSDVRFIAIPVGNDTSAFGFGRIYTDTTNYLKITKG